MEVNEVDLIEKLKKLSAKDLGRNLLKEVIFYDSKLRWRDQKQFIRVREAGGKVIVTYKYHAERSIDGSQEIEFSANSFEKVVLLLEKAGLVAYRHQEKKRHTFKLEEVTIDIDTWPRIPTYVELEGPSEKVIKKAAKELGFDWSLAVFDCARTIIEKRYSVPVSDMHWFTFNKFE